MKPEIEKNYKEFMTFLGGCEEPLAAYYYDKKPAVHTGPKGGFFLDIPKPGDLLSLTGKSKKIIFEKIESLF